jgi:hypothetical protein
MSKQKLTPTRAPKLAHQPHSETTLKRKKTVPNLKDNRKSVVSSALKHKKVPVALISIDTIKKSDNSDSLLPLSSKRAIPPLNREGNRMTLNRVRTAVPQKKKVKKMTQHQRSFSQVFKQDGINFISHKRASSMDLSSASNPSAGKYKCKTP